MPSKPKWLRNLRIGKLEITLPVVSKDKAVHVVVDSTGVKVYGEGEWSARSEIIHMATHQHQEDESNPVIILSNQLLGKTSEQKNDCGFKSF
jgi:hypothetical protein